jgi:uncharacterized membrane protein YuzA (DUF378 family)
MGKKKNHGTTPFQLKIDSDERILKFQSILNLVQSSVVTFGSILKYGVLGFFTHAIIKDIAGKSTNFSFFTNLPAIVGIDLTSWIGYFLALLFLFLFLIEKNLERQKSERMLS